MTDIEAIKLTLAGDKSAFETIICRYQQKIFQLAYHLVWQREEAEDLVQEVFLRAYQNLNSFDLMAEFYPWLHKVAVNTVLTHLKHNWKRQAESPFQEEQHGGNEFSPETALAEKKQMEQMQAALASLTAAERLILTLRGLEGLSYAAIATRLDCSLGTVMSRLNRARASLRQEWLRRKS